MTEFLDGYAEATAVEQARWREKLKEALTKSQGQPDKSFVADWASTMKYNVTDKGAMYKVMLGVGTELLIGEKWQDSVGCIACILEVNGKETDNVICVWDTGDSEFWQLKHWKHNLDFNVMPGMFCSVLEFLAAIPPIIAEARKKVVIPETARRWEL